ncbi:hypothetical protein PILCRDRAFT_330252 [Piloderma croceum F 1598]|uniref:Uncharacterized protein n=1 Tax=Piloderma croceum (strain F 1598) TaxID=765440 RepID=A0A0C3G5Q6_PILCF|nr:hypothetical protein PILCRDRAFT_330252 [Piloderma croceum F 1598]
MTTLQVFYVNQAKTCKIRAAPYVPQTSSKGLQIGEWPFSKMFHCCRVSIATHTDEVTGKVTPCITENR